MYFRKIVFSVLFVSFFFSCTKNQEPVNLETLIEDEITYEPKIEEDWELEDIGANDRLAHFKISEIKSELLNNSAHGYQCGAYENVPLLRTDGESQRFELLGKGFIGASLNVRYKNREGELVASSFSVANDSTASVTVSGFTPNGTDRKSQSKLVRLYFQITKPENDKIIQHRKSLQMIGTVTYETGKLAVYKSKKYYAFTKQNFIKTGLWNGQNNSQNQPITKAYQPQIGDVLLSADESQSGYISSITKTGTIFRVKEDNFFCQNRVRTINYKISEEGIHHKLMPTWFTQYRR